MDNSILFPMAFHVTEIPELNLTNLIFFCIRDENEITTK